MGDEVQDNEKKMRLPAKCRMVNGEIICDDNAQSRELKPEGKDGALFTGTRVQMEDIRCAKDRKTGKMRCRAEFTTDELPEV